MFKVGQKAKTVLGYSVEIVAILKTPDDNGHAIIGVKTNSDGEREIETWTPDGIAMLHGKRSCLDLAMPPRIEVQHVFPPIPDRRFDWCARYSDDDEEGPRGWGRTRDEAIADLTETHPREAEVAQ